MPSKKDDDLRITCGWKACRKTRDGMASFVTHVGQHLYGPKIPCKCPWTGCDETSVDPHDFEEHIYVHAFHTKLKTIGSEWLEFIDFTPCTNTPKLMRKIKGKMGKFQCKWRHVDNTTTHNSCYAFKDPQMFYDHVNEISAKYIDTLKTTAQENSTKADFVCLYGKVVHIRQRILIV